MPAWRRMKARAPRSCCWRRTTTRTPSAQTEAPGKVPCPHRSHATGAAGRPEHTHGAPSALPPGTGHPEHTHGAPSVLPPGTGRPEHTHGAPCALTPGDRAVRSCLLPSLTCSFSHENRSEPRSPATRARTSHCRSAHAHLPTPGLFQGQGHIYSRICVFLNCLLCVKSYNFHLVLFFTNITQ